MDKIHFIFIIFDLTLHSIKLRKIAFEHVLFYGILFQDQDHYGVLGLRIHRYKASDDDIKKACECCYV